MDDFFTSPLRKTLDPQVEIFPLALEDRRFDQRANAAGATEIAAAPVDATVFDRIGIRDEPVDPQAARPTAELATTDFVGPPFWASDQINIVDRKPNLNTSLGYQSIVDAIKFFRGGSAPRRKPEFGGWIRKKGPPAAALSLEPYGSWTPRRVPKQCFL